MIIKKQSSSRIAPTPMPIWVGPGVPVSVASRPKFQPRSPIANPCASVSARPSAPASTR